MVHEARSYTRVTLALDVVRRIADGPRAGYHELAVVKHQIDLYDTIRIEEAECDRLVCNQPGVPTDTTNICLKAAELMRRRFGVTRSVAITIEKRIPVMGGLAGGSANAATAIGMLDRLWGLGAERTELMAVGRELGMDVPYYFVGGTALDAEVGGEPERIETSIGFDFVLVIPRFGVSTREAYAGLDYGRTGRNGRCTKDMVRALRRGDFGGVVRNAHNDFEFSVFETHPELADLRRVLLECGCRAAFLSGSGSTVVGIAESREAARGVAAVIGARPEVSRAIVCATAHDVVGS